MASAAIGWAVGAFTVLLGIAGTVLEAKTYGAAATWPPLMMGLAGVLVLPPVTAFFRSLAPVMRPGWAPPLIGVMMFIVGGFGLSIARSGGPVTVATPEALPSTSSGAPAQNRQSDADERAVSLEMATRTLNKNAACDAAFNAYSLSMGTGGHPLNNGRNFLDEGDQAAAVCKALSDDLAKAMDTLNQPACAKALRAAGPYLADMRQNSILAAPQEPRLAANIFRYMSAEQDRFLGDLKVGCGKASGLP
jgi:hypothetical protein